MCIQLTLLDCTLKYSGRSQFYVTHTHTHTHKYNGKESTSNAGDPGSIPGSGRSRGGGHGNPLQYSCVENHRGPRSLVGYSPRGCKESDMTEQLSTHIPHIKKREKWLLS